MKVSVKHLLIKSRYINLYAALMINFIGINIGLINLRLKFKTKETVRETNVNVSMME